MAATASVDLRRWVRRRVQRESTSLCFFKRDCWNKSVKWSSILNRGNYKESKKCVRQYSDYNVVAVIFDIGVICTDFLAEAGEKVLLCDWLTPTCDGCSPFRKSFSSIIPASSMSLMAKRTSRPTALFKAFFWFCGVGDHI